MNKVLLGIIVDASSSMRKNWGDGFLIKQSKIEAIKNALNEEIKGLNKIYSKKKNKEIEVFCLGIGFKLSLNLVSVDTSDGEEIESKKSSTELVGIICDILALSELVPSKDKLDKIKLAIQEYWNVHTSKLLSEIEIDNEKHLKLAQYIENSLTHSYRNSLHNYFDRQTSIVFKTLGKFLNFIGLPLAEVVIRKRAKHLGQKYATEVHKTATSIFSKFSVKYQRLIETKITNFAEIQINYMLERNSLGFSIETILNNFDRQTLELLSEDIINAIKQDINREFKNIWKEYRLDFLIQKFKFLSSLSLKEVEKQTEETIKNAGWKELKPFMEKVVFDIFAKTFEKIVELKLNWWIQMATQKEVIRPIRDLSNLLPDTSEKSIYSDKYMFGSTPMLKAVNLAILRFNDRRFKDYTKIFLIISDGDYKYADEVERGVNLLKNEKAIVICGLVTDTYDLNIRKQARSRSKENNENLINLSSAFSDVPDLSKFIDKDNIDAIVPEKLCIKINEPKKLQALFGGIVK